MDKQEDYEERARKKNDQYNRLVRSLTNQTPDVNQIHRIEMLRTTAKQLGADIIGLTPTSREQSLALTKLEEATMWAVKAIALEEDE